MPPRVVCIIPARDEEAALGPALDAVLSRGFPAADIIVVDKS